MSSYEENNLIDESPLMSSDEENNLIDESPLNRISALFDSEQWVITKNHNGMVKVATCDEDETRMYDKTRDWLLINSHESEDSTEEVENELEKVDDIKKDAVFLIRDLLKAKECNGYFILNNIKFRRVFLCGVVIQKNYNEDNYFIQVDDSTSSVRCVISKINLEDLNAPSSELEPFRDRIINNKDLNDFLKASSIMLSSINYMQKATPSWDEIELGDVVNILSLFLSIILKYVS
ncbi:unnamed protein product [Psylliodes chrysocephalus]|uniref:Uncharacterized protein n=1 Tax=Psylliodes chrysocephalus TaxID=3402493 RepID=A0A9P0CTK7_9CUCU|nr:unnamed protein product [Psylliodes chrysocephala]